MKKTIIEIKRADEKVIKKLIEIGVIYIGEDNQLHVSEPKINKNN